MHLTFTTQGQRDNNPDTSDTQPKQKHHGGNTTKTDNAKNAKIAKTFFARETFKTANQHINNCVSKSERTCK